MSDQLTRSQVRWSLIIYGEWLAQFLFYEFSGLTRVTPWVTLSETVWFIEDKWRWLAVVIAGGLFALTLHFALRWPEYATFSK